MTEASQGLHASEIRAARNTRVLNLSGRKLTQLPRAVRSMTGLVYLNLSNNYFGDFPMELAEFTSLETLDLSNNHLSKIPSEIGSLVSLQALRLGYNRIETLPPELAPFLRRGGALYPDGNAWTEPFVEYLRRGDALEIATFLESLVDGIPQFEAKVLLLGEGNVGKTSLVAALRGEPFVRNRSTTHGIEIGEIAVPHPNRAIDVVLRTWDFGGQEVYRITHQFFFGRRALYLVVWNPREGQEQNEVEGWLRRIRLRVGADMATIIVATHVAERSPELDYPTLQREFPQMLRGQHGVDSETNEGIEGLRSTIAREAARLPQMGQVVSVRWIAARNEVIGLGLVEPQITFEEFSAICSKHDLSESEISAFASLLHDLGQIVYYGDDDGLRDVVVLNPEWLTKAIGFVLEDRQTRDSHGVLSHRRLKEIWVSGPEGDRYPARYHPYFLRLMEKFDVSYRLEDGDSSLVAQLVPHERPDIPWDDLPLTDEVRSLQLTCSLSEPAPGLIAWLTVRNHRSSTNRHWRQGIFLRHPNPAYASEALIELKNDRELLIEVRAPSPDLFFNVLRDGVEDLLIGRWKGLNYKLEVPCPGQVNDEPCPARFTLEGLLRLRERGKDFYDCIECDKEHSVQRLLTGFSASPLAPELERLQEQLKDVAHGLESVERYTADSAASVRRILRATSQEVIDCPRLFTLISEPPTAMQRLSFWRNSYRLTLWCEHTAEWHPWHEATYQFQRPKEWLVKVGPYASLLARTLRLVIPMATSIAAVSLSKEDQEKMQQELDLMKALTERLPENLQVAQDSTIDPSRDLNPAEGAGLRGFRYVLFQIDKAQQFGGLKRVQAPSGEFLYVCPRHYSVYDPGLPVLPA